MAAEKNEQAFIKGIEDFEKSKLKHTETQEKNLLPDKEGEVLLLTTILWYAYNLLAKKLTRILLFKICSHDVCVRFSN